MNSEPCSSCRSPKAPLSCELCGQSLCKKCVENLEQGSFSFLNKISPELTHHSYCRFCYDDKIAPVLEKYNEIKERAKSVAVFFKTQKKPPPLLKRSNEVVRVKECLDRDETILRLAFFAAELGFNAIVDTDVSAVQVRNAGYQSSIWSGKAVPAQVDQAKLDLDDAREEYYR